MENRYLVLVDFEGYADFEYVVRGRSEALACAKGEFGGLMAHAHCWNVQFAVYEKVSEGCPFEGKEQYLVRAEFYGAKGYVAPVVDGAEKKAAEAAVHMLKDDIDPDGDKVVWGVIETDVVRRV